MKVWLFRAIAVSIPFLFFAIIEFSLCLANYGHSYPLFIENPNDTEYLLPRPDIVKRYFPNSDDVPAVTIEANFFRKHKPQDGFRVFVQGGSTAAGFPYGFGASVAGMLDHRLKQTFPDKYVETVNTALAAVNSYTNMDMVDEIIAQQPDAVLFYMGHNEFLGILGVGSNYTAANSRSSTLMFLKLKELRIFQLLQNLYAKWNTSADPKIAADNQQSRTFMAKVAKHKTIEFDSDIYQAGLAQFEQNLAIILKKYQAANVPVFIATLTSNLLDQPPFASAAIPDMMAQKIQTAMQAIRQNKVNQSQLHALSNAVASSGIADANYQVGRLFYAVGDAQYAKKHLTLAKENDLLRFRAPEAMNNIIRRQAIATNATVIEAQQRFEQRSQHGIVGNNLMLEHLHPNVQGYFLLADAFYQGMKHAKLFSDWTDIETNLAWQQRMILPSEEYFGFAKVLQLKTDYPFVKQRTPLSLPPPQDWQQQLGQDFFLKKINWLQMVQQAQQQYMQDNDVFMMLKTQLLLADALPFDKSANQNSIKILKATGNALRARTYEKRLSWAN
ncbi:hypothetical protein [Aliiglaciecola litoralis]|uniref:SGNH hydrolase-type esterase domain-containing protein n=1 Tax=Aliiglaciecola litoralis TaxID=582857 RepID=A0ABN1LLQ4_9ALTE